MADEQLWGGETAKAVENFPISGETVPVAVVHWLARIKGAAAAVNGELGLLPKRTATRIEKAAAQIAAGKHDAQFPIDVFQTGSGTSTNTNANEVIARLAGEPAHPNDHVNMGQSSNDVFPSAVHLAALDVAQNELLPALKQLERSFAKKAKSFENVVKAGRTHLMDAVPVTLGQEFAGYAAQMRLGQERVQAALVHVGQIPLGGTATGTGLNTHARFAEKVRARLKKDSGLKQIAPPADPFEAQANRDALVELSGALKVVAVSLTKIAGDLALMGSGPRAGIGELFLPELQKGSSIMPGKVNPVIPEVVLQVSAQVIGNDTAITIGGMQGQFELNVRIPLIARNLLQSLRLLSSDHARVRREVRGRHPGQQGAYATPRLAVRSRSQPRSTARSATTRAPRSSRRRPRRGVRCARSRWRRASTPSCTTPRSTCARSRGGIGRGTGCEVGAPVAREANVGTHHPRGTPPPPAKGEHMSRFATINLLDIENSIGDRAPGIDGRFARKHQIRATSGSASSATRQTCVARSLTVTVSRRRPTSSSPGQGRCCSTTIPRSCASGTSCEWPPTWCVHSRLDPGVGHRCRRRPAGPQDATRDRRDSSTPSACRSETRRISVLVR